MKSANFGLPAVSLRISFESFLGRFIKSVSGEFGRLRLLCLEGDLTSGGLRFAERPRLVECFLLGGEGDFSRLEARGASLREERGASSFEDEPERLNSLE